MYWTRASSRVWLQALPPTVSPTDRQRVRQTGQAAERHQGKVEGWVLRVTDPSGTDKMEMGGCYCGQMCHSGLRPGQVTKWGSLF